MAEPLSTLSAREAARRIARGTLSAEALLAALLDRIALRDSAVEAFEYLDREKALEAARRRDSEPSRGRLHGVPVAVKDLIDTCDMPTGYGSPIYKGHRPAADASCVAVLRKAGAIVLGKTVTTEFAAFTPGKTRNPCNPAHTPGGSSSGSAAAVADFEAPLALGSQTAGSVIRPASFCGCVGFKPSFLLINRTGTKPLSESLDTLGVFSRSVEDAGFLVGVLCGRKALCDLEALPRAPHFGLYRTPYWEAAEKASEEGLAAARDALSRAGARVSELSPAPEHLALNRAQDRIMGYEMARSLAYERFEKSALLSPRLKEMLEKGAVVDALEYDGARREGVEAGAALGRFFADCDAILAPAAPGEAPAGLESTGDPVFNRMWTLLGVPALSLPVRREGNALPVGVQLVGRVGEDARLLSCALFLERALGEAK